MKNLIITKDLPYDYDVYLNDLAKIFKSFPYISRETIGYSVLKKPIYAIRFGQGDKKIIITGAHHGSEWITSMLTMALINKLCLDLHSGYNEVFSEKTIYFVPMVNPDGVNLSINGITPDLSETVKRRLCEICEDRNFCGIWQANIHGVDLNHNYDASFEKGRKIQISEGIIAPAPTKYSGLYPESEPETRAIVDLTKKVNPDIVIAYHSQGEEIFYKYQGMCSPDAEKIAQKISALTGYDLILADGLTDCTGYKDWVIEKFNIPAYTIEVGKGKNPLSITQFEKIYSDNKGILDVL